MPRMWPFSATIMPCKDHPADLNRLTVLPALLKRIAAHRRAGMRRKEPGACDCNHGLLRCGGITTAGPHARHFRCICGRSVCAATPGRVAAPQPK